MKALAIKGKTDKSKYVKIKNIFSSKITTKKANRQHIYK